MKSIQYFFCRNQKPFSFPALNLLETFFSSLSEQYIFKNMPPRRSTLKKSTTRASSKDATPSRSRSRSNSKASPAPQSSSRSRAVAEEDAPTRRSLSKAQSKSTPSRKHKESFTLNGGICVHPDEGHFSGPVSRMPPVWSLGAIVALLSMQACFFAWGWMAYEMIAGSMNKFTSK